MANEKTKTLNVRLQQRWATAAEWAASTLELLPGEMAIESDTGKFKFGVGGKTFSQIENYAGIQQSDLTAIEDNYYHVIPEIPEGGNEIESDAEALARTVTSPKKGDIAVCERVISGNKKSMTAYMYDNSVWSALDGNYDATNVYFKDNITLAGSYTAVGNVTKSSNAATGELPAAGKSLAEVMQSIFTKELYPATGSSINKPTISLSGDADASGEVGSSYTLPTVTVKVDDVGAYTYGPATGIKFEAGNLTIAQGAVSSSTNKKSNESDFVANSTMSLTAADSSTLYTDNAKSYEFNASGSYTQGAAPKTNLGNYLDTDDSTEEAIKAWTYRIPAGSTTATKRTIKRSGYRYMFCGGTTAATVDSGIVRGFTAKKNSKPTTEAAALEFEAAGGSTKVICAYPNGWTGTPYFEMFGLAWAENSNFKAKANVDVADARGTNDDGTLNGAMAYKVYAWELETPLEAETTKFRVYFK